MTSTNVSTTCKLCGSTDTVKFGRYRGIPRRWCKSCHRKYADNEAIHNMRTPLEQVSAALEMYYNGYALKEIPGLIFRQYGAYITYTSVFNWVTRFSRQAARSAAECHLSVGPTWAIDETGIRIRAQSLDVRLIDIIDIKTRFLLASSLFVDQESQSPPDFLHQASHRAGQSPGGVLKMENAGEIRQIWRRASGSRDNLIHNMKKPEIARLILEGWSVHYNYFSPQDSLQGRTPAAAARSDFGPQSWMEIIREAEPVEKAGSQATKS